jgi:RNA polymerase sigma-70 factor, ECF subfamily
MGVSTRLRELERLYRTDFARFARVAAAITRDAEAAAEAVQEAFVRAIRRQGQFRGEAPLEAWIWRIVVNEAKRHVAAPATMAAMPAAEPQANGSPPDEPAVRALIAALPERQRLAVFLRYYADLDYRTIGEVLEVESGTVSATLAAAHRSLRQGIEGVRS